MSGTASETINVVNVSPTAKIISVTQATSMILPHESISFSGSFFDPGTADSHTVTWSFGDGATSTTTVVAGSASANASAAHAYDTPGTYTVTLSVTEADGDGGLGQATTKITVMSAQDALRWIAANVVANITTLNGGQKNSLIVKLNNAADSLDRGNTGAANNQLNAFLNEVQADLGSGKISSSQAATLTTDVHSVQAALGTYNRFLQWWPLEA
jgi:PKD repeat protein